MTVSQSEINRIETIVTSLKQALTCGDSPAIAVSSLHDRLNELTETVNHLLKKNHPPSPGPNASGHAEGRYRNILNNIQECYFETDLEGHITFFNDRVIRDLGYPAAEIRGLHFRRIVDPEDVRKVHDTFHQVFVTGKPIQRFEWKLVKKNGQTIDVESSTSLMLEPGGRPCGFCGIMHDITERKLSEKELQKSEERYRHILDAIEESYFEVDLKGNMLFFNDSSLRDMGFSAEELRYMNFHNFTDPRDLSKVFNVFHRVFQTGEPVKAFGWGLIRKDGTRIDIESSVNLMHDDEGRPVGFRGISRDVSGTKATEHRLRLLAENIRDVIWTRDFDLNFTYVSPSVFNMTGHTPDEAMRMPITAFLPAQQSEPIRQLLGKKLERARKHPFEKGETTIMEMEARRKDGSLYWVEISADFNRDEQGLPFEIIGVTRDITERKKMEAALRENEKRYRMIVENMHDTIWTMDMNLRYTYQSPSEIRVTGYTPEEVMQISPDQMMTPDSFERASGLFAEELALEASGAPFDPNRSRTIELEIYHKNGGTLWQEVSASFNRDENGKAVEIMLVGRDITERKKMEAALRESEKRYRMIVENMHEVIWATDLSLRYTYISPSSALLSGYTPGELAQIPLDKLLTPDSFQLATRTVAEELSMEASGALVDPNRSRTFEQEIHHKNGGTFWLEITGVFNRDENGEATGLLMVGRDITARKKAEAEREKLENRLSQAQKMETVGRLAGGIAHDFNNMLNVILGYVELAKMRITMVNPVYSDLMEIEKAAVRSRELTAQLLAFSRKQIISPQVVDLNDLIEDTRKAVARLIGEDIRLTFHPGQGLWPIKFDPVQIEQILINLAVNARDAMPGGGKLLIQTSNFIADKAFCDAHPDILPADYVLLTVSDTGRGIDKGTLPHVFEPFFTTKEVGKGTGLGLATVYGIIKQNNGFISVESEPGSGSSFNIYLHRTTESPAARIKKTEKTVPIGSGNILLVEDDELVLKTVSNMLEAMGYMVIATENPQDALSLCRKAAMPIDLMITDVIMPQMSGRELRDRLMDIRPDLQVLFMSGYSSNIIARHGIMEEGMHYIQKPFSITLLAQKIKQMIAAN